MSIENSLERIATALEIMAGNAGSSPESTAPEKAASGSGSRKTSSTSKSSKSSKSSKPSGSGSGKKEEKSDLTVADVRKALTALQKRQDAATAKKVLEEAGGGALTLSKLKPEKYAAVIEAANATSPED